MDFRKELKLYPLPFLLNTIHNIHVSKLYHWGLVQVASREDIEDI